MKTPKIFGSPHISLENLNALYLNLGYYFCGLPFKIRFSKDKFEYEILKPHMIFRILIATMQTVSTVQILWSIFHMPEITNVTPGAPSTKVKILSWTFWQVFLLVSYWTTWTQQDVFTDILKRTNRVHRLMKNMNITILGKWKMIIIAGTLTTAILLITFIEVFLMDYAIFDGSFKDLYNRFINAGHNMYFFENSPEHEFTAFDQVLAVIRFILVTHSTLLTHFYDCLCLSFSIPIYLATTALIKHLKSVETSKEDLERVMNLVDELLELCATLATGMALMITCETLLRLPYHCLKLREILDDTRMLTKIRSICLYTLWIAFLIISAQINEIMRDVVPYLRKTQKFRLERESTEKLDFNERAAYVTTEIMEGNLGIRGIGFTITYGLIGHLTGLIITYSMIIYTFRDS